MKTRKITTKLREKLKSGRSAEARYSADSIRNRPSSFPFISGDGFALCSDYTVPSNSNETYFSSLRPPSGDDVIFVEADFAARSSSFPDLLEWLKAGASEETDLPRVIIHNGDATIPERRLLSLEAVVNMVFAVNITHESHKTKAIPIGLENVHYKENGALADFVAAKFNFRNLEAEQRKGVISAFNIATNPSERSMLAESITKSRHTFVSNRIPSHEFRGLVSKAKFVISPPGNGPDCHRTWESIYLGAIPVVKRGFLAESLVESLPIHAVDSWDDFLGMTDSELELLFEDLISRETSAAYLQHWHNAFKR